jgi:hypothetical protein
MQIYCSTEENPTINNSYFLHMNITYVNAIIFMQAYSAHAYSTTYFYVLHCCLHIVNRQNKFFYLTLAFILFHLALHISTL